jgi:hypothetical protein
MEEREGTRAAMLRMGVQRRWGLAREQKVSGVAVKGEGRLARIQSD